MNAEVQPWAPLQPLYGGHGTLDDSLEMQNTSMHTVEELKQETIGIVGFGKEGQAVAQFLHGQGVTAHVFDAQPAEKFDANVIANLTSKGFIFHLGEQFIDFAPCSALFRSPGVPRLSPALIAAEKRGATITSQTKWFFANAPCKIIGVTGTKGKGTTTTLINHILALAKQDGVVSDVLSPNTQVYVTGNIGKQDPFALLSQLKADDLVLFELSSFQLQDLTQSPWIGVCLMVTQEHLDHHATIAEYHEAKRNLITFQNAGDVAVYSADYPASVAIGTSGAGEAYSYSRYHTVDKGVYAEGEAIHVVGMSESGAIDVSKRLLRGPHNIENMCAATAVAVRLGVPLSTIEKALITFPGLEHRLEFAGEYGGVRFYNDSISTVPESSIAALASFSEPKIIILGGSDKGSDFTELGAAVAAANMRGVIVIGQMTERITAALTQAGVSVPVLTGSTDMAGIFNQIRELSQPGDVVLLSPACASFGMFQNYKDRGEQFVQHARTFSQN